MTASVDLHTIINEVFSLTPPSPDDFPPDELNESLVDTSEWRLAGAMQQYEALHPLIVSMARALEDLLSRVESLSDLVKRAEGVSDDYDHLIEQVIASDGVKIDTYRAAIERLSSEQAFSGGAVVEDNSFSGIELQARMTYAKTILEGGPR